MWKWVEKLLVFAQRTRKMYPRRLLSRNSKRMDPNWQWLELIEKRFVNLCQMTEISRADEWKSYFFVYLLWYLLYLRSVSLKRIDKVFLELLISNSMNRAHFF